jgi:hypothetical protein
LVQRADGSFLFHLQLLEFISFRVSKILKLGHPHRRHQQDRLPAAALPLVPMKIQMYLKRYHDIDIATSAVYRILKSSA